VWIEMGSVVHEAFLSLLSRRRLGQRTLKEAGRGPLARWVKPCDAPAGG